MQESNCRYFEFSEFRLDAHRRTLQKNGEAVHLTPRSFDLLQVMVENAGRTLTHDELLDRVWPDTFVEQGNLKKLISGLRRSLGESPDFTEFIVTVPRSGYRFTPSVRTLAEDIDNAVFVRETKTEIVIEEEIEDDLQPVQYGSAPQLAAAPKRSFLMPVIAIVAAAILLIGSFAAWIFISSSAQRFSADSVSINRLMSENNITGGTISTDGNFMAYSVVSGNERSLWVRQVAMESGVQIVAPVNAFFWEINFTPNADFIYYTYFIESDHSKSGLYRIPVLGGTPQMLGKELFLGLKFSPDGSKLAVYRTLREDGKERQELVTLNADGGDEKLVIALPQDTLFNGIAWSADGNSILYGARKLRGAEKTLYYVAEVSASGGAESVVIPDQEKVLFVEDWLPDGKSFLLRQREPQSENYQIWQYFPSGKEFIRVTNDDYTYTSLTPALDGKTLGTFRTFAMTSLWQSDDPAQNIFRQLASGINSPFRTDWTKDGQIVFSMSEAGREYIGVMQGDGSQKKMITSGDDGILLYPRIAGDGEHIVFISDRAGNRQAWQMDMDGRERKQLTDLSRTGGASVGEARLLSDGNTVIYRTYIPAEWMWCLFRQTPVAPTARLTTTGTHDWDISPDEKLLAVYLSSLETGKRRIAIMEIESGKETRSLDIGDNIGSLRWSPSGDALDFVRSGAGKHEIIRLSLNDGKESVLNSVAGENITDFSWSRDGKKLTVVRGKPSHEAVLIKNLEKTANSNN